MKELMDVDEELDVALLLLGSCYFPKGGGLCDRVSCSCMTLE
jgi:hypothetical protein